MSIIENLELLIFALCLLALHVVDFLWKEFMNNFDKNKTITAKNMIKKLLFYFFIVLFLTTTLSGDTLKIGSLENSLATAEGKIKVDILNKLSALLLIDSSEKAIEYTKQASDLAIALKDKEGEALALYNRAKIYYNSDDFDNSLSCLFNALKLYIITS